MNNNYSINELICIFAGKSFELGKSGNVTTDAYGQVILESGIYKWYNGTFHETMEPKPSPSASLAHSEYKKPNRTWRVEVYKPSNNYKINDDIINNNIGKVMPGGDKFFDYIEAKEFARSCHRQNQYWYFIVKENLPSKDVEFVKPTEAIKPAKVKKTWRVEVGNPKNNLLVSKESIKKMVGKTVIDGECFPSREAARKFSKKMSNLNMFWNYRVKCNDDT